MQWGVLAFGRGEGRGVARDRPVVTSVLELLLDYVPVDTNAAVLGNTHPCPFL